MAMNGWMDSSACFAGREISGGKRHLGISDYRPTSYLSAQFLKTFELDKGEHEQ